MGKKNKIMALVIGIIIIIISIHDLFNFVLIPMIQKAQIIKSYTENVDKFEKIHNCIGEKYYSIICNKDELSGEVKIYKYQYVESGGAIKVEIQIEDKLLLEQIKYILFNLDFDYIENTGDYTSFNFRNENGHIQRIDYTTQDITKIHGWNTTKLKDNWYYLSIWTCFNRRFDEPILGYCLRVIYHVVRGG